MRRAFALLALSGALFGAPALATAAPPALLAQSRVPAPPEPTPGPTREQPTQPTAPARAATPADVDEDSPGWILPAVVAVAALALLAALLSLTSLDPGRIARAPGRRFGAAGARTSEALAGLRDRARLGR